MNKVEFYTDGPRAGVCLRTPAGVFHIPALSVEGTASSEKTTLVVWQIEGIWDPEQRFTGDIAEIQGLPPRKGSLGE